MSAEQTGPAGESRVFDVVIVGAGFAGLYELYRLREVGFSVLVLEAGSGVGGTWFWNRYPGARCDVESLTYSYSWSEEVEQEWEWTSIYAGQPEILQYINHVADRFDLRGDIELETRVTRALYDDAAHRWAIETDRGETIEATYCIMAVGSISQPNLPDWEGLDSFEGAWYHTAQWPEQPVDFTGKRVGVVGTGSTGIQVIPVVAEQAEHLTVFQRTPNFSLPQRNGPLDEQDQRDWKAEYTQKRSEARQSRTGMVESLNEQSALAVTAEERERECEQRWANGGFSLLFAYEDILTDEHANELIAEFVRNKIRATVKDPEVAELLCPTNHAFATKRPCQDTNYYETYNRDNVSLVDVRSAPIQEITPGGLRTSDAEYELDAIILATGFDALTGTLFNIDIRGKDGLPLREKWAEYPVNYLGIMVEGFPNLFTITGPGSPGVLSNMMVSVEQHVDWVADCIRYLRDQSLDCIEPTREAENEWVEHVNEVADTTLYPRNESWYTGANIEGKSSEFSIYVGGVGTYREKCDEVVANGYEGFALSGAAVSGS